MKGKQGSLIFFLCLSAFIVRGQEGVAAYASKWKAVDSLINKKGLTQSALGEVNKIYAIARQEKNEPQAIRALVYRLHLDETRTEAGLPGSIKVLEKEIDGSGQPARSILQNILAGIYLEYLQQNRWRINSRTNMGSSAGEDVTTWSVEDLNKKISALYLASLKEEGLLARIDLNAYDPIIIGGNTRRLRPTLFDLLAHTALDYFKAGESYIDRYSNPWEPDDPAVFVDAASFVGHPFPAGDSLSPSYQALLILQRLIRRHLGDADAGALLDVDIERLGFAQSLFNGENKQALYLKALHRLTDRYKGVPAADQAIYLQANEYADNATNGLDSTGNSKARAICEPVVAKNDSSEGWANCRDLLHTLLRQELSLQTESVNIPNRPMRALVNWRNFTRLYLRVIRLDENTRSFLSTTNFYDSNYLRRLLSMPIYYSAMQQLPGTNDHLLHRVEIGLGALPAGDYALLGTTDSSWSQRTGVIAAGQFTVSIITYMNLRDDYFVLNRETGRPLAGAVIQLWDRVGYNGKPSDMKKMESYATDENGHFLLKPAAKHEYRVRMLELSIPGDHLFPRQEFYHYPMGEISEVEKDKESYEKKYRQCFLFTDRSIYRPGQTVLFKGIEVTRDFDTRRSRLIARDSSKLILFNANNEKIDSIELVSNEFGSYHGSFRLPEGQLNGVFRLSDETGGSREFSVEEYKRPKFFVDYEKQKGSYRLGDSIHVAGTARGYAGNPIGQAKVSYNVVRRMRFTDGWQYGRIRRPFSAEVIIAHGVTATGTDGRFRIVFLAAPDREISRTQDPAFEYSISADVTDISGETRSGSTSIAVGYTALKLSLTVTGGDHLPSDSFRSVVVHAGNLSGEPVGVTVHLTIYPLKIPQRLIRDRLWAAPDRYVMTEKEWLDSFPHDEYRDETQKENWEKGGKIWETTAAIAGEGARAGQALVDVPAGKMVPGWYLIETRAVDKYGQEVKDLDYEALYDGTTGKPAYPQYSWAQGEEVTAAPGQRVTTSSGSSADVYVIRSLQRAENPVRSFSHFTIDGEKKTTDWTITDADRGGFGVLDVWVKDNRLYTHFSEVNVPWTNKQLDIHYSTFRDKSEPGSAEKWEMKVSGQEGEKVSAEILTAMYDGSLDQFREQSWDVPELYPSFRGGENWSTGNNFSVNGSQDCDFTRYPSMMIIRVYDRLLVPSAVGNEQRIMVGGRVYRLAGDKLKKLPAMSVPASAELVTHNLVADSTKLAYSWASPGRAGAAQPGESRESAGGMARAEPPVVQVRKDFRETAFFFPDLRTDSAGNVSFSFMMPEAVTSWKWMTLAHTKDLAFGYSEKTVITQKELMVQPNAPRFLREGDRMELPVKVVNLTDSEMTGQISLELTDPTTGETADGWFTNLQANQYFTVGPKQSAAVGFPLNIPYQYNRPLTYKIVAQSGKYSDGEEATLPVVSNRLLVTESLPLTMPGDGTKHFVFDKLAKSGSSETLNHHALTVEFTTNPAWYAVQSLPYLMEYPYECSEQTFERLYANALATRIADGSPRLQQVLDRWREADTAQLLSNLQKNQQLKTVLLEETPWVMEGKSEAQQKKNIALLFDIHRMSRELASTLDRLRNMQSADGAFPWWSGGPDNRYITQYILTGIGHLQRLNAIPPHLAGKLDSIVADALRYLDTQIRKDYEEARAVETRAAKNAKTGGPVTFPIGTLAVHYLYMRSLFPNHGLPGSVFAAVNYFRKKAQHDWVRSGPYLQGMIALALYRTGDIQTAKDIIASLKQNAIRDPEQGMYWKGMQGGYYWYQAPVETESLLIEAFHEISGDVGIDTELKTWLLKQKQTHSWATTTATADACYALLIGRADWLNAEREVEVKLGGKTIVWGPGDGDAGIGYHKKVFDGPFVNASMGDITVTMQSPKTPTGGGGTTGAADGASPAWGAVYWQYFDMLDRITPPGGSRPALSVNKKLFIRRDTDRGSVLDPLSDNGELKPGDRVVVRIEVRADREMEYVHLKDMRAACLEPVNVISRYKWQDGLGYYESTKDASTDFFFDVVPRGTYVLEYELLAGQSGNFSNGITTIECLYAPEFTYHTEGIRVNVETGN